MPRKGSCNGCERGLTRAGWRGETPCGAGVRDGWGANGRSGGVRVLTQDLTGEDRPMTEPLSSDSDCPLRLRLGGEDGSDCRGLVPESARKWGLCRERPTVGMGSGRAGLASSGVTGGLLYSVARNV